MGTIQEVLSGLRRKDSRAIEVRPSVGTLLVLARTLELTPEQFRRCGREDAAAALSFSVRRSTCHEYPSQFWRRN